MTQHDSAWLSMSKMRFYSLDVYFRPVNINKCLSTNWVLSIHAHRLVNLFLIFWVFLRRRKFRCLHKIWWQDWVFLIWSPFLRRHFFNHLLWSVFQSSYFTHYNLQLTSYYSGIIKSRLHGGTARELSIYTAYKLTNKSV